MTIAIRRPGPDEAPAFAALHVACWKEAYRGIVPDKILASAGPDGWLSVWQGALADSARIVLGACDGGEPVGFILAGPPLDPLTEGIDGQIYALYIRSNHQRRGIGRRLMGTAARAWLGRGGIALTLGVLEGNSPARNFYEALGGRQVTTAAYDWEGYPLSDAIYVFEDLAGLADRA
ncbi:GNAT family N-acetyltransferase [Aestuariivirga sp.]|uniref:GNAT family N-acetyltransferase n=1 Tax=Aestuariivirga sp. TaxID=2650926 RepID=UPI0035948498